MMGKDQEKQYKFMFVNLEDYIPKDHLLRKIIKVIDFSFIYDKVNHLYFEIGRRSIDPVLIIKMLLLGYLYGIPSERKLEQEVKLNLAYRWFLGLDLADSVPDHSTFSQNRRRRFKKSGVFEEIFNHVVRECVAKGLIAGEIIVTDSTHIKASVSGDKVETVLVAQTPSAYLLELEAKAQELEKKLQAQREAKGNKKCGKKPDPQKGRVMREVKRSITDPDSGLLNRPGKPAGYCDVYICPEKKYLTFRNLKIGKGK